MVAEHLQFHYFLWGEKEEGVVAKTSPAPKIGKPALFCLKQGTACSLSCLKDGTASCLKDGTACSPEPQRWDSLLSPASKMGQPVISLSLSSKTGQPALSCLKDGTASCLKDGTACSPEPQRWDSLLSPASKMGQPVISLSLASKTGQPALSCLKDGTASCLKDGTACSPEPQRWDSLLSPASKMGQPVISLSLASKTEQLALSCLKDGTACYLSLLLQRWDSMLSSAPKMGQPALFCLKDGTACYLSLLLQRWDSMLSSASKMGQPALSFRTACSLLPQRWDSLELPTRKGGAARSLHS